MEQILTTINNSQYNKDEYYKLIDAINIKIKKLDKKSKQKYFNKIDTIIKEYIFSKDNPVYDYINSLNLVDIDINVEENKEHDLVKYDYDKYGHHLYSNYYYSIDFEKDNYNIIFSFNISIEYLKEEYQESDDDNNESISNRRTINIYCKDEKYDFKHCDKNPITQFFKYNKWDLKDNHINEFKQFLNKLFSIFECKYELKWKDKNKH
jgi:hypothetical protein